MAERIHQVEGGSGRTIRLFSSVQPDPRREGSYVDTFHIYFDPACEATSQKTFLPKSKETPTGYRLAHTEAGRITELVVDRGQIGWSSDREGALIGLARGLAKDHNYQLDPTIQPLPTGVPTASQALAEKQPA